MMTPEEQLEDLIETYEWESEWEKDWRLNKEYEEYIESIGGI